MTTAMIDRSLTESAVRRRAAKQGYSLHKSRVQDPKHPDYGMYVLRYWRQPEGEGTRCASLEEVDKHLD